MKPSLIKFMILLTVILMDVLTGTEFDLFVPSFPELQTHFNLSPSWVEALLSANFIGYFFSLFFLGDLSDRYGRRPIIILGLLIFTAGSILCLWPQSYAYLLVGRFMQGTGIAAPAILSFLIIADTYPLREQQFLMAMLNGSLNIAAGLAPVAGSYITLYFHWQGNFVALLILGLIVLAMTVAFIPHNKPTDHHKSTSLRGISGYITIFKSKTLVLLLINLLFLFVPYWIFVGISPLLYIKDLGVSLAHFGYYQGSLAIVFAVGSIALGLLIKNASIDHIKLLRINTWLLIIGTIILSLITLQDSTNPLIITLAVLVFIIGQIVPSTILYPICLNFIPLAKGRVSAIIQGGRLVLTSIALQIAGYFYIGSFRIVGIMLISFILVGIITSFFVIKNSELQQYYKSR